MVGFLRTNKSGFTLVEVMIALFVFVFLTLIFAACAPLAKKTAKMNGQYSQAISLCQHKLDQLRAVGYGRITYTELKAAGIIDASPTVSPYSFVGVDTVANYLYQPTATLTVQSIATNQLKVTATIVWKVTAYESRSSRASLTAIVTNVQ